MMNTKFLKLYNRSIAFYFYAKECIAMLVRCSRIVVLPMGKGYFSRWNIASRSGLLLITIFANFQASAQTFTTVTNEPVLYVYNSSYQTSCGGNPQTMIFTDTKPESIEQKIAATDIAVCPHGNDPYYYDNLRFVTPLDLMLIELLQCVHVTMAACFSQTLNHAAQ